MLMQCNGTQIRILPSWPLTWDVDCKLCAPGNTTVRVKFQAGAVTQLVATPAVRTNDVIYPAPPTVPPSAPTGLTATDGNAQISLAWAGDGTAVGYNVKRANVSGGPYSLIATIVRSTSYLDTGLVNGTTYYYVVSAVNSLGASANSSKVSAMPVANHISASNYSGQSGTQLEDCSEGGQHVAYIENGDWCRYDGVDFGPATLSLKARVASDTSGGTIEVRLDTTNGPLIGTLTVPNTGGWQTYTTVSTTLTNASGVQNLFLRFVGAGAGYLFNVEWIEFTPYR